MQHSEYNVCYKGFNGGPLCQIYTGVQRSCDRVCELIFKQQQLPGLWEDLISYLFKVYY